MPEIGQELLNVPFPEMIEKMGMAISRAQMELDIKSCQIAQLMAGNRVVIPDPEDPHNEDKNRVIEPQTIIFGNRYKKTHEMKSFDDEPLYNLDGTPKMDSNGKQETGTVTRPVPLANLNAASNLEPAVFNMLELGFTPTFYQFTDTIIEVKISISFSSESKSTYKRTSARAGVGWGSVSASSVSASYSSKYSYHAEGSSLIRTKLVPIPPPSVLEERIRQLMQNNGVYPIPEPENARI